LLDWFDFWMRGVGSDPTQGENVRFWRFGENAWASSEGRRIPARHLSVPLASGALAVAVHASPMAWPPADTVSPVPFFLDTGTSSGMHLWGEDVTVQLQLPEGVQIEGAAILALSFTTAGCTDADLNVRVSLVNADGTIEQLTEGRLRLSQRAIDESRSTYLASGEPEALHLTHARVEQVREGKVYEAFVELLPTSLTLAPGQSLRVGLSAVRTDGGDRPGSLVLHPESRLLLPALAGEGE
jgi:hypothetical protein